MARTPKVTADEIATAVDLADEQAMTLHPLATRAREKGVDVLPTERQIATLMQHQAALADLISALMTHRAIDESNRALEGELRQRAGETVPTNGKIEHGKK